MIPTKYFGRVFRTVQRFEYSALMIGFEVLSKIPFEIENYRIPILIKRIISERSICISVGSLLVRETTYVPVKATLEIYILPVINHARAMIFIILPASPLVV